MNWEQLAAVATVLQIVMTGAIGLGAWLYVRGRSEALAEDDAQDNGCEIERLREEKDREHARLEKTISRLGEMIERLESVVSQQAVLIGQLSERVAGSAAELQRTRDRLHELGTWLQRLPMSRAQRQAMPSQNQGAQDDDTPV